MTVEQRNELSKKLWDAEKCLNNIREAKQFIDDIKMSGIKVKVGISDADLAGHLDVEFYETVRNLAISRLQRTINENKEKFESL